MSIIKVACGEYRTVYLHSDGSVWGTLWDSSTGKYKYMQYPNATNIVDVAAGQYTCLAIDKSGIVYELYTNNSGGPATKTILVLANPIKYIQMLNQAKLFVDIFNNLYYLAETTDIDAGGLGFGVSTTPQLILSNGNNAITKIVVGENTNGILMLTSTGKVLQFYRGNKTPVTVLSSGIVDIEMIGRGVFFAVSNTNVFVWGKCCNYIGLNNAVTTPTAFSLSPEIKLPFKKLSGSWNTLHILDADNNLWGIGENVMGEIGNGKGWPDWKNYKAPDKVTPSPFAWNWLNAQMLQTTFVKLDSKWTDIYSGGSMAFYHYALNTNGKWYAWGRNKGRAIPTGITLPDNDLAAKYPNWSDVWYPIPVTPENVQWSVLTTFDVNTAANNFSFTPIQDPTPVPNILGVVAIKNFTWNLYDDGSCKLILK